MQLLTLRTFQQGQSSVCVQILYLCLLQMRTSEAPQEDSSATGSGRCRTCPALNDTSRRCCLITISYSPFVYLVYFCNVVQTGPALNLEESLERKSQRSKPCRAPLKSVSPNKNLVLKLFLPCLPVLPQDVPSLFCTFTDHRTSLTFTDKPPCSECKAFSLKKPRFSGRAPVGFTEASFVHNILKGQDIFGGWQSDPICNDTESLGQFSSSSDTRSPSGWCLDLYVELHRVLDELYRVSTCCFQKHFLKFCYF